MEGGGGRVSGEEEEEEERGSSDSPLGLRLLQHLLFQQGLVGRVEGG